jgi:hypothetical protein
LQFPGHVKSVLVEYAFAGWKRADQAYLHGA